MSYSHLFSSSLPCENPKILLKNFGFFQNFHEDNFLKKEMEIHVFKLKISHIYPSIENKKFYRFDPYPVF